jgi:hypothetical protein
MVMVAVMVIYERARVEMQRPRALVSSQGMGVGGVMADSRRQTADGRQ